MGTITLSQSRNSTVSSTNGFPNPVTIISRGKPGRSIWLPKRRDTSKLRSLARGRLSIWCHCRLRARISAGNWKRRANQRPSIPHVSPRTPHWPGRIAMTFIKFRWLWQFQLPKKCHYRFIPFCAANTAKECELLRTCKILLRYWKQ